MVSSKQTGEPPFTIHDSPLTEFLAFAHELADAAGAAIRPYFGAHGDVESKADDSPVTHADRAAEYAMRTLIAKHFPEHGMFGEEFGEDKGRGQQAESAVSRDSALHGESSSASRKQSNTYTWVLDPIDGTRAFIAGGTQWGTLIALCENGVPILGILDQPVTGERWVGARGMATTYYSLPYRGRVREGASGGTALPNNAPHLTSPLQGEELHTRPCATLSAAAMSTTSARYFTPVQAKQFRALAEQCNEVIADGDGYAYGLLARGVRDIVVDAGLKPYDILALVPIIEGAGGKITAWDGLAVTLTHFDTALAVGDTARHAEVLDILHETL